MSNPWLFKGAFPVIGLTAIVMTNAMYAVFRSAFSEDVIFKRQEDFSSTKNPFPSVFKMLVSKYTRYDK